MKTLKIEKAVVFAPFKEFLPVPKPNEWLIAEIKSYPNIFGFATISPLEKNISSQLSEFKKKGLVGIKFHPPIFKVGINDSRCQEFYSSAEELALPILIHTGAHGWYLDEYRPLLIDRVARKHPDLRIIIEHMGGYAFFNEALAVVENNPHCYAGISSVLQKSSGWYLPLDRLTLLLERIGSKRIIYGFDFPWNSLEAIKRDLLLIKKLKISTEDKKNMLGNNIATLLAGN